jgi:hypothetical protein
MGKKYSRLSRNAIITACVALLLSLLNSIFILFKL